MKSCLYFVFSTRKILVAQRLISINRQAYTSEENAFANVNLATQFNNIDALVTLCFPVQDGCIHCKVCEEQKKQTLPPRMCLLHNLRSKRAFHLNLFYAYLILSFKKQIILGR